MRPGPDAAVAPRLYGTTMAAPISKAKAPSIVGFGMALSVIFVRARPGTVPEALIMIALVIPMLITVVVLSPELLIGPFLSPTHRRFVLRLLDSLRQWSMIVRGQARGDETRP